LNEKLGRAWGIDRKVWIGICTQNAFSDMKMQCWNAPAKLIRGPVYSAGFVMSTIGCQFDKAVSRTIVERQL